LDKRYTEIGVAVGYGMYKGQKQWLAVQHFARPMSSCPSPNTVIKDRISKDKEELAFWESDINSMKKIVDKTDSSDINFQSIVSSYNALVNNYNNKLNNLKSEIATYNEQVKNFNSCLDAVTTSVF
jgi:peptidoglycan hydrolase CwlO-like protein